MMTSIIARGRLSRGNEHFQSRRDLHGLSNLRALTAALASLAVLLTGACDGRMVCEGEECGNPPDTATDGAGDAAELVEAPDVPVEAPFDVTADADAAGDEDAPMDLVEEEEPPPPPSYSFVVFGDNQFATTSCTSGVSERLAVPRVVLDLAPTLLVHTGDLMDHGYEEGAYEAFVGCYDDMLAAMPFFPTGGNHDFGSGGVWSYKAFLEDRLFVDNAASYLGDYAEDFAVFYEDDPTDYCTDFSSPCYLDVVPSGVSFKTFYAWRYENAYFISFEIGTRWWSNTPKTWLEDHLGRARSDPSIRHIFVYMHHPTYSTTMVDSSDGECTEPVRRHYASYFHDYDVTMVFSGHAHIYEHFYVPDDGSETRARPAPAVYAHDGEAVHYVITGGGGGPLPNGCDPIPPEREELSYTYSQQRGCGYHVTWVEVEGDALHVSVIGVEGSESSYTTSEWDAFSIE
jgi:hypothetical protein